MIHMMVGLLDPYVYERRIRPLALVCTFEKIDKYEYS